MLQDVETFNTKLSKINGSSDVGTYLVQLIKDKTVLKPAIADPKVEEMPAPPSKDGIKDEAPLPPIPTPADEEKKEANIVVEKAAEIEIPSTPVVEMKEQLSSKE